MGLSQDWMTDGFQRLRGAVAVCYHYGTERSDLFMNLLNLKKDSAQLKSEHSDVKKDCESSIADLKEEIVSSSAQGPMVHGAAKMVGLEELQGCECQSDNDFMGPNMECLGRRR
jgi:hypothetical protein